jgi:hypothetical protein
MTGFSRPGFMALESILKPPPSPFNVGGRPPKINFRAQLGLFLMWTCSRMRLKDLCLLFECLPSSAHSKKFLPRTASVLRKYPDARIKFPDIPELARLAALVQLREPLVSNVSGFIDGCSFKIEFFSDLGIQNAYYDEFTCDTCVNHVFLFSPEGKILHAAFNFPGSWHDSTVSMDLVKQFLALEDNVFAYYVDQGFPRKSHLLDKFVGPYSKKFLKSIDAEVRRLLLIKVNRFISLWLAAEWGMRAPPDHQEK